MHFGMSRFYNFIVRGILGCSVLGLHSFPCMVINFAYNLIEDHFLCCAACAYISINNVDKLAHQG